MTARTAPTAPHASTLPVPDGLGAVASDGTPDATRDGASDVTAGNAPGRAVVEPLGSRFQHLLAATTSSNLADGVLQVGVPLLALTLTRSPLEIAAASAAATLPWLLLSLPVGVAVDRFDRVRLLAGATALRVATLVGATAAAVTGVLSMPVLLVLLLVLGVAEVVADSSSGALVPSVTPRSRLNAANSRLLGAQQLANAFLGGPAAGLLLGLGTGWLFGVPAGLCALTLLAVVRGLWGRVTPPAPSSAGAGGTGLREGLEFVLRHRVVRPLLLTSTAMNFASTAYFAVFVLWVVGPGSAVGLPAPLYGVLTAILAVGALLGAVVTERLVRRFDEARLIGAALLVQAVLLVLPVVLPTVPALVVMGLLIGFANMVGNVVSRSLRQRLIPDRLLGRVGGASTLLAYGAMPLGALTGGAVGGAFGLPAVFVGAAAVSTAMVVWTLLSVNRVTIEQAERDAAAR
ncbi:MFS transporter [Actinotalea sp. AC32]|nr:MFS transporter [Actinotalea sp. AC32]